MARAAQDIVDAPDDVWATKQAADRLRHSQLRAGTYQRGEFMSTETFRGGPDSPGVPYTGEYTYAAWSAAALRWAEEQDGGDEETMGARRDAMERALASCGVRAEHIETYSGYLVGWSSWLRACYKREVTRTHTIPADTMDRVRSDLLPGGYYNVTSPDPLFTGVKVKPRVSYAHSVVIDGVRWSVDHILRVMERIEECDSDRGGASLQGSGEDQLLAELLERHAGLQCRGGYHSSPRYDADKFNAFRERLIAVTQLT